MNYSNHSLRTDLQEWKNRLYRSPYQQFGHQLKFLFGNFENNKQILGMLKEAMNQFPYSLEKLTGAENQIKRGRDLSFESETDQASFCYQFLKHVFKKIESYNIHMHDIVLARDFEGTKSKIIEEYISPIIYHLHDKLDKSNSTIYLLEKYKKRTEWFTKYQLYESYQSATKNYEKIFEDDLRLFLFDQGIEYPFSTPSSASGRADIVGEIETDDPLVIEIKIFDQNKGYGKKRIKEGFTQIVKYANDYNKDIGYLVIFNLDDTEINLINSESDNFFPPSITFNNKTFYFVIVNCQKNISASKIGELQEIEISLDKLTKR